MDNHGADVDDHGGALDGNDVGHEWAIMLERDGQSWLVWMGNNGLGVDNQVGMDGQ